MMKEITLTIQCYIHKLVTILTNRRDLYIHKSHCTW